MWGETKKLFDFIIGAVVGLIVGKLKHKNWPTWLRAGATLGSVYAFLLFLLSVGYAISFVLYRDIGGDSPEVFVLSAVVLLVLFVLIFIIWALVSWIKGLKSGRQAKSQ